MSATGNGAAQSGTAWWKKVWVVGLAGLLLGCGAADTGSSAFDEAGDVSVEAVPQTSLPAPEPLAAPPVVASVPLAPAPAPAPVPAPPPVPAPAPAPAPAPVASVYYQNCDDVRAHGAAPIHPGDPGFQPKFDRDNDGVGCEN